MVRRLGLLDPMALLLMGRSLLIIGTLWGPLIGPRALVVGLIAMASAVSSSAPATATAAAAAPSSLKVALALLKRVGL